MQHKLVKKFNKCLKQKKKSQEKLKYITFNLKDSSYFDYKEISSTTFASVHICKTKCNRK